MNQFPKNMKPIEESLAPDYTELSMITPEEIRPFPRAERTKESSQNSAGNVIKKRKAGRSQIATDSPELEKIRIEFERKTAAAEKKTVKAKRCLLPSMNKKVGDNNSKDQTISEKPIRKRGPSGKENANLLDQVADGCDTNDNAGKKTRTKKRGRKNLSVKVIENFADDLNVDRIDDVVEKIPPKKRGRKKANASPDSVALHIDEIIVCVIEQQLPEKRGTKETDAIPDTVANNVDGTAEKGDGANTRSMCSPKRSREQAAFLNEKNYLRPCVNPIFDANKLFHVLIQRKP